MNAALTEKLLTKVDWVNSVVGEPRYWPELLKQSFHQTSSYPLPACVLWGDDNSIIFNEFFEKETLLSTGLNYGQPLGACLITCWQPVFSRIIKGDIVSPIVLNEVIFRGDQSVTSYFNIHVNPLIEAIGQIVGYILTFVDVTEKVKWQKKANTLQENLQTIVRHAPVAMAAFKGENLVVELANQKVCDMWGKPYEDCIGKPVFEIIPEVKDQGFEELVKGVIESGEGIEVTEVPVMKTHNGHIQKRYMSFSYEPLKNEDGIVDGLLTVGLDVTDSVRIKEKFTEAQQRNSIAIEAAAIGTFELLLATNEIITSTRFDNIFGVAASKKHQTYTDVIHPDDIDEWKHTLQGALDTGKLAQQYRISKSDGSVCWVETLGRVYYDDNGKPEKIFGTAVDVTVQLTINQKLVDEQKHLQVLLNSLPTIAWTNSPSGEVNFYNQQWYDYTGLTFEETKAWGWKEVIHPDDLQYNLDTYASILSGDSNGTFEIREKGIDGVYRWHLINMQPVKDDNGHVIKWIGTATDIQRLKDLEKQKEEFISIASHELKTPLTSVKAFNQIMLRSKDQGNLREFVVKSKDHITRLEKLINDLLDVSKISSGKLSYDMQLLDFERLIAESVESAQMTTKKHKIVFESCYHTLLQGDPNRLEQVLNNLLNNAIKYSPEGGTITVTCHTDNNGLVVAITDQGIGIEKHHLSKLFNRYYRIDDTDMRFSGLGLGLYITAEVIKRHNGSLWIESEPGKGSTFFFRLPLPGSMQVIETNEDDQYKDNYITINYSDSDNLVACRWTGHQNIDSIKRCCLRLLKMCVTFGVSKILADNTFVEGTWTDATDWVAKEFYPMMDEAGIRRLAWVHSKSAFSQLAAEKTIEMAIGRVTTKFFDDLGTAHLWLIND